MYLYVHIFTYVYSTWSCMCTCALNHLPKPPVTSNIPKKLQISLPEIMRKYSNAISVLKSKK